MINKLRQTLAQAGDVIKEQASSLGDAAKQKGYSIIDEWIANLPKLEEAGLESSFFSLTVSISPTLEVELIGDAEEFDLEKIQKLLEEAKGNTPLTLVYTTIKTTYQLYQKAELEIGNPLAIRIRVRISPEIRVSYGEPVCE
ncbi:MAG TPA: hypothetical protein ENJ95_07510 [Bacteroidetes bacterium]|nr:hypothetical protein [Bacteroidota bacterium]